MSSIVKILEVIAESEKSFADAAQQAVREAAKSVRGINGVWMTTSPAWSRGTRSSSSGSTPRSRSWSKATNSS